MADTLTPKQEKAIIELLNQPTIEMAAKAVGVNYTTLYRWLKDPVFNRAYKRIQDKAVENALSKMQNFTNESADILMGIARDETVNTSIRLNAIKIIWDTVMKTRNNDIADRIDKLESQSQDEEMELTDIG
jgi:transposase-like protein